MIRWVVVGAGGRMGCQLVACAAANAGLQLAGAVDRPDSGFVGRDAGELAGIGRNGVGVGASLSECLASTRADVVVDFSHASAAVGNIGLCATYGAALVLGTTGLPPDVPAAADAAAGRIPLLIAANTSLGVTLLTVLAREVARALPADFDIEIVEAHHRYKKDAPSGTALALGRAVAEGRGRRLEDVAVTARHGGVERRTGEIGFAVVRGGDIVGDHTVLFAGESERLTLGHQATDRSVFARGALRAAEWLAGRKPGRYSMVDVLSIKQQVER
jgi:4-hydroxy-tetrahydrodipicolinate reductase